jgi:ATP-dependent Clp protease ATP-binding subunit ClpC
MGKQIIPKVKTIFKNAMNDAKGYDDKEVRPEHLINAILIDNSNKCMEVLKQYHVDYNKVMDDLSHFLKDVNFTPRITPQSVKLPNSKQTLEIIDTLDEECVRMGDLKIDTTHLMLAILGSKPQPHGVKVLKRYGITYSNFSEKVKDMNNEIKNAFDNFGDTPDEFDDKGFGGKKKRGKKATALDNFCRDVTKAVEEGKIDPIVGREKEIKRVSQILARRKKNNPVLIGEPGVGKTSVVEGLAQLIHEGNAPRVLLDKRIYSLDLTSIVAGTKYRGQFEERMKVILEELTNNKDIVLFIDELHTLVGAGNSAGSLDGSNIFKPSLARGEIQIIGATTLDEYREHVEKDGALKRRFQEVLVEEPTLDETRVILENIKEKYENHHKVEYTKDAIDECVKLADRYMTDRAMPDKAIDILDEAGASTNISVEPPKEITKLEDKLRKIKDEKLDVIKQQKYEEAAQLRDNEKNVKVALEDAKKLWQESLDTERKTVDADIIAEVVSMMTGIPINKMSTQESKKLMKMDEELADKVIGQQEAVQKVVQAVKRNRIGIKDKKKPIGSFIFLGPTGVGKTHLAKVLAEYVFGDPEAMVRIDMSEYMEKFTVSRLVGAPPGYVGYEEGGQLTEKVRRKPYSVILFDEIEKAHDDVFNLLLQLLDEGQITDGLGRKVNFKNTLIIMTSNIGVSEANSFGSNMGFNTKSIIGDEEEKKRTIIEKSLKKKFKPEFLNRLDDTIIFNSLSEDDIAKIIILEIKKLRDRVKEMGYDIKVNKSAIKHLIKVGYDVAYGARPLGRAIQKYIEDPVSDEILNGHFEEGDVISVSHNDKTDEMVIKTIKK